MRIAIDIRSLMEGKTTGVEVYLTNLLHHLFRLDQKNEYILWANSFRNLSLPEFSYPNVQLKVTKYPNKFFNLAQKIGFPKIESLLGPIDLFFSPHWRVTALTPATPLVVTFHDLVSEIAPQFFSWRRRLWHSFMNYRNVAEKADKIIAVSESTKQDLVDIYGIEKEKITVVYPGLPHPSSLSSQGEGNKDYFLYLGAFEPRKNIESVIAAYVKYHSQSQVKRPLVIAGSTRWKTLFHIPESVKNFVRIRKNIDEEEKIKLYKNAFAFLFPSFYEGFGFPVLEAASHGLPVITSYSSSLAEVANDFALFTNPFRPNQIASAMLELEHDRGLYDQLKGRGLAVVKRFDWQQAAAKTLAVFGEALA